MQKKLDTKIKRIIVACVVAAIALSAVAFAEFMESKKAKRVVASYSMAGDKFSSDYLKNTSVVTGHKEIKYINEAAVVTFDFSVCNYPQSNKMAKYDGIINYTIEAELYQNGAAYTGAAINGASVKKYGSVAEIIGASSSVTGTLTADNDTDKYTVTIPAAMVFDSASNTEPIYIKVTATTDASGVPHELSALFGARIRQDSVDAVWTGKFSETEGMEGSADLSGYDGFNYIISGNGTATVTLRWNPDIIVLNKESYKELGIQESDIEVDDTTGYVEWKKIVLDVNAADILKEENGVISVETPGKPRYAIQFFRNTSHTTGWTKSDLESAIAFSAAPIT